MGGWLALNGVRQERAYWLGVYDDVYLPLVERVMEQAQQSGFGLKHSRQSVGSQLPCVDRLLDFSVWCCGIHWCRATDDVGSRLPIILRSAFRRPPVWIYRRG